EPPVRPARRQGADEGRRRDRLRCATPSVPAAAPRCARRAARHRAPAGSAGAALGPMTIVPLVPPPKPKEIPAMRRQHFIRLGLTAAALLLACGAQAQDKGTVGVSMPTKSSARWIDDGNNMVKYLKDKGYKADLQYADDDIPNQLAQVENMITKKV